MVGLVAGLLLLFPDLFEGERAGRERERERESRVNIFRNSIFPLRAPAGGLLL